ncbi:MAG: GGDEF domain-containing protein [Actinobacteria bacterium]|nr:GGDEF domain-containing protein [Actinomycetota bacterium]
MTPAEVPGSATSLAEVERQVELRTSERFIASLVPVVIVIMILMAGTFWLVPGGQISALVALVGAGAFGIVYVLNRRGHRRAAAGSLAVIALFIPLFEPATTGNLSTNGLFVGIATVVAALVLEHRRQLLALAAGGVSLAVMIAVTSPESTPPVTRQGSLVSAAALLALVLLIVYALLRTFNEMSHRAAAAAQREAAHRAAALQALNSELTTAIEQRAAALNEAIGARQALAAKLQESVVRDPLTGLLNRRYLDENITRFLARGASVAILDVDAFKAINDRLSYRIGDQVLTQIAELLAANVREGDLVVRYGGEEFALLMPATGAADALVAVEELRAAVGSHDWSGIRPGLQVTISAGVFSPGVTGPWSAPDFATAQRMLGRADDALHRAKDHGRNRSEQLTS